MNVDLIDAVRNGAVDEVYRLLEQGSFVDTREETFGDTPLFLSAFLGSYDIANLLLRAGAHVDARNNKGRTPLMAASFRGNADLAQLLIKEGADVNLPDDLGRTPLLEACRANQVDSTKLLIEAGARPDSQDAVGRTPLTLCAMEGHSGPAALLLANGTYVNVRDKWAGRHSPGLLSKATETSWRCCWTPGPTWIVETTPGGLRYSWLAVPSSQMFRNSLFSEAQPLMLEIDMVGRRCSWQRLPGIGLRQTCFWRSALT